AASLTKVNPDVSALVYPTYLGGHCLHDAHPIAVDTAGNAYVTGDTLSRNFPTTPDATQPDFGGDRDAFVTKFDPSGSALVYSTYLGGRGSDEAFGHPVDTDRRAYVPGSTSPPHF